MDIFVLGALVVLGVPIAAIAGFVTARGARRDLDILTTRFRKLETEVRALRGLIDAGTQPASSETVAQEAASVADAVASSPEPAPERPASETLRPEDLRYTTANENTEAASVAAASDAPSVATGNQLVVKPAAKPAVDRGGWERQFSERWMVWLGGIALALGGAFMVKFSIDQGFLGPAVRVALGCLLGAGIMGFGHWLSYRPSELRVPGVEPSYVSPALVGAGAAIAFASLFAAYALHHLLPPLLAFAGLAMVAVAAALLSLRHGPFVAALGLAGALAVPLLVRSDAPNAYGLFIYLLLVTVPMMALLRWRGWWWLAWIQLGGSLLWVALWLAGPFKAGDEEIIGVFLLVTFGIFVALRRGIAQVPALSGVVQEPQIKGVVVTTAITVACGLLMAGGVADFSTPALISILAFGVASLAFAYRDQTFDLVPIVAAVLSVLTLLVWDLPIATFAPDDLFRPTMPDGTGVYAAWAAVFALLFGGAGFAACGRSERPVRWAALSAGAPIFMLVAVYWRLSTIGVDLAWAALALILAALLLVAAQQVNRRRDAPGMEAALGAYAVGVVAAIALAATMALEEAWLTVALSLTLPGMAWVNARLRVPGLRVVALIAAAVVLVRLVFNPYILGYPIAEASAFNWLLYGYGIPALAFAAAAYLFGRRAMDLTAQVLEAGAILFAVMLVSLEIYHGMAGGLNTPRYYLDEQAVLTITWLFAAACLFVAPNLRGHLVVQGAGYVLLVMASIQAVVIQALLNNPFFSGQAVGETPIFNLLLLVFGFPAALFVLHAYLAPDRSWRQRGCGILALVFSLLWVTLEVRHGFTGSKLSDGAVSNAELYSYSVSWMAVSALILAIGFKFASAPVRRVGLGLLLVVVFKVFIIDMAHLDGILRALSFLGLGAALVALGWFYRRFVGAAKPVPPVAG